MNINFSEGSWIAYLINVLLFEHSNFEPFPKDFGLLGLLMKSLKDMRDSCLETYNHGSNILRHFDV